MVEGRGRGKRGTAVVRRDAKARSHEAGATPWSKVDWDGGEIIHDCVVEAARPRILGGSYDIDVREFIQAGHNAVLSRVVQRELQSGLDDAIAATRGRRGRGHEAPSPLRRRAPGGFDLRAAAAAAFVAREIQYERRKADEGPDPWQFPDETLAGRSGDCEDRALLLASLLLASGISNFNVRVAFGEVRSEGGRGAGARHGHAWVMYRTEAGHWTVLEPLLPAPSKASRARTPKSRRVTVRYVPFFLLNDRHLWRVRSTTADFTEATDGKRDRRRPVEGGRPLEHWRSWRRDFRRMDPRFVGEVHRDALTEALQGVAHDVVYFALRANFRTVFGHVVDDVDYHTGDYDPREHFDSGYLDEGWRWVTWRLERFAEDPFNRTNYFAYAAHAIADFYAHTSYPHFAAREGLPGARTIPLYDPTKPHGGLGTPPRYAPETGFDLDTFTAHRSWQGDRAATFDGELISGRYGMTRDTWPGFLNQLTEGMTWIPKELRNRADFPRRYGLPHHNEIAVDAPERESDHTLYRGFEYDRQFALRKAAAVAHIRKAYLDHHGPLRS